MDTKNDPTGVALMEGVARVPRTTLLAEAGQSAWLDFISASLLNSGKLARLVASGSIFGVTSNPTIFAKAVASDDPVYRKAIRSLRAQGKTTFEIYDSITRRDVSAACDVLASVYEESRGTDGFVSLEVSPDLAGDEEATVAEAARLRQAIDKPNLLVKVPATPQGIRAVRRLVAQGHGINVTLIFSRKVYRQVAAAYRAGLRELIESGKDPSRVTSVASFFVSRLDTAVDKLLDAKREAGGIPEEVHHALRGQAAVANSKLAYADFKDVFLGPGFKDLAKAGAQPQRLLWASTGAKDPAYPDLKYVEPLIGPMTVNTMPTATLQAFSEHGRADRHALESDLDQAKVTLQRLAELGIDLEKVCAGLLDQGVEAFAKSFHELLATIEAVK